VQNSGLKKEKKKKLILIKSESDSKAAMIRVY